MKINILINIIDQLIMVEHMLCYSEEITPDMYYDFWKQGKKVIIKRVEDYIAVVKEWETIADYDY